MLNDVREDALLDAVSIFNHLEGNGGKQQSDKIQIALSPNWNTNISEKGKELIKLMVEPEPRMRLTAE